MDKYTSSDVDIRPIIINQSDYNHKRLIKSNSLLNIYSSRKKSHIKKEKCHNEENWLNSNFNTGKIYPILTNGKI